MNISPKSILILLCTCIILMQCKRNGEQSVFILPNGFVGNALIIFGQQNGSPAEYQEGVRIYHIPSTGILKTQFLPDYGWHKLDEFYYTSEGGRAKKFIPCVVDSRKINPANSDTICFRQEAITDSETPRGHYLQFTVSRTDKLDSLFALRSTQVFDYLKNSRSKASTLIIF